MFKNFKTKIYFIKNLSHLFKVLRLKFKKIKFKKFKNLDFLKVFNNLDFKKLKKLNLLN
jgi:hypothetical protein